MRRLYRKNDRWVALHDSASYLIIGNKAFKIEDIQHEKEIKHFLTIDNERYELILKKEDKPVVNYQELEEEDYDILGDKI